MKYQYIIKLKLQLITVYVQYEIVFVTYYILMGKIYVSIIKFIIIPSS